MHLRSLNDDDSRGLHRLARDFRRGRYDAAMAKRSEKPKKALKKQPQKTLKERRTDKRAAKKFSSG